MRSSPYARQERDFARRWGAGEWRGVRLISSAGWYTVLYEGRPGGPAGPDFRDAVLLRADGARLTGDIELHLRLHGWRSHRHHMDPRYDRVALHVICLPEQPAHPGLTVRADGEAIPVAVLPVRVTTPQQVLPCAGLASRMPPARRDALLRAWGARRIRERADMFANRLHALSSGKPSAGTARQAGYLLWPAIAEALAYGRDRDALHQVGELLVAAGGTDAARAYIETMPSIERARGQALLTLFTRYGADGLWPALAQRLAAGRQREAVEAVTRLITSGSTAISTGRARIVVANVIVPAALAISQDIPDSIPAKRVQSVFDALPGLPSNQITRLLVYQFGMPRQPSGASAQQGLQHIWTHWCREKRCDACPCNVAGARQHKNAAHLIH